MNAEEKKIVDLVDKLKDENLDLGMSASEKLLALGQVVVPYLLPYLKSSDWPLRFRVASLLHKLGVKRQDAFQAIEETLKTEKDKDIQKKLLQALMDCEVEIVTEVFDPSEEREDLSQLEFIPIEWFEREEALEIRETLEKARFVFRERIIQYSHPKFENYYERHIFDIEKENFPQALETIQHYFGFDDPQGAAFTGECPACETACQEVDECPECGLKLACNPMIQMKNHPFMEFLLEQGLLKQE